MRLTIITCISLLLNFLGYSQGTQVKHSSWFEKNKALIKSYNNSVNRLLNPTTPDRELLNISKLITDSLFENGDAYIQYDLDTISEYRKTIREYLLYLPIVAKEYTRININLVKVQSQTLYYNDTGRYYIMASTCDLQINSIALNGNRNTINKSMNYYSKIRVGIYNQKLINILHTYDKQNVVNGRYIESTIPKADSGITANKPMTKHTDSSTSDNSSHKTDSTKSPSKLKQDPFKPVIAKKNK